MELKDFQALANPKTGLVAMKVSDKRSFAPYRKGDIAGFPPEVALSHWENGVATIYGYDEPGQFKPAMIVKARATEGRVEPVERKPSPSTNESFSWEAVQNLHYLRRIALAERLGWKKPNKADLPEGTKIVDKADEFLRAEAEKLGLAS